MANGAAGRPGCALSYAASVSVTSCNHSSSCDAGRAFNAGIEPMMPALHCSITSLGLLMMNSGEPITGRDRFCKAFGSLDMQVLEVNFDFQRKRTTLLV